MRILLYAASVVFLAAGCKKGAVRADAGPGVVVAGSDLPMEVEPNDRIEQATPITSGKPIRGRILGVAGKADVDCFRITSTRPKGVLRAEVTGVPGVDLVLSVISLAPRRELARANNGGAGEGEVIPNVGVAAGDYVIRIGQPKGKKASSEETYTLTVTIGDAAPGDELEPNDKRADAQEIDVGTPVRGYFGRKYDVDWYRLKLPDSTADSSLRVEMTAVPGVSWARRASYHRRRTRVCSVPRIRRARWRQARLCRRYSKIERDP